MEFLFKGGTPMKKLLLCLLALMLAVPALAEGDAAITLTPAGSFSSYADFEDDCARVIDTLSLIHN